MSGLSVGPSTIHLMGEAQALFFFTKAALPILTMFVDFDQQKTSDILDNFPYKNQLPEIMMRMDDNT